LWEVAALDERRNPKNREKKGGIKKKSSSWFGMKKNSERGSPDS